MAMPSSGAISIGNIVKEILTGNGSTGTTTPNSTQVNLGISSLKTTTNLTHGTGSLTQYYSTWDDPTTNNTAPYQLSEFYGKQRDGVGDP
jgi:hypothetical protein